MKATEGIKTLLGDSKGAIVKLSIPMIITMSMQNIYNLVDVIWVSGPGTDALVAVGFVFALYFMANGLSNGLEMRGDFSLLPSPTHVGLMADFHPDTALRAV